jgi:hypothetical protein
MFPQLECAWTILVYCFAFCFGHRCQCPEQRERRNSLHKQKDRPKAVSAFAILI